MAQKTFSKDVEGIGTFTFKARTMREHMAFLAEYSRLVQGNPAPTPHLDILASAQAALKVLTVEAPEGWNIEEMDPLDPETSTRIIKVALAHADAEKFFRSGGRARRADASKTDGAVA